jgi:hypothetical protein
MVYEVLHSVLVNGARLASAILPAAPLLGLKRPAASGSRILCWFTVRLRTARVDRR